MKFWNITKRVFAFVFLGVFIGFVLGCILVSLIKWITSTHITLSSTISGTGYIILGLAFWFGFVKLMEWAFGEVLDFFFEISRKKREREKNK